MEDNRRPVSSRKINIFHQLAKKLVLWGFTPNQISVASAVFAFIGGLAIANLKNSDNFYLYIVLGLIGIQLRLVCNLIDGLMAVEGGLKTSTGELYNDVPDRFSDLFLIVGLSFSLDSSWSAHLGWCAGVGAVLTAYVRTLGASMGQGHDFKGPFAKQHRMGILNVILIAAVIEKILTNGFQNSIWFGLVVLLIGSYATVIARLKRISNKIK